MCPACLSTMALIAAGAGSTGGLAALVLRKARRKPGARNSDHDAQAPLPENEEKVR